MKFDDIIDMPDDKAVIKKIHKVLTSWTDEKTDHKKIGYMKFFQKTPIENRVYTDKDVREFKKQEGYKHIKTPEQLSKVAAGMRKSLMKKVDRDVEKLETLVSPYHGVVSVFNESDKVVIEVDLGGLIKL